MVTARSISLRAVTALMVLSVPGTALGNAGLVVTAPDGTPVHMYEYAAAKADSGRLPILMFHQGNGDARGELDGIARRLSADGHRVFTTDLRSGGPRNATAAHFPTRQTFCQAYPDLEAALSHVRSATGAKPILVGSSFSASLVVQLAAKRPADVSGFVSFSPAIGLRGCADEDHVPATRVPGLAFRSLESKGDPAADATNALWRKHRLDVVELDLEGHGASLLVQERIKGDVAPVWARFERFIRDVEARAKP